MPHLRLENWQPHVLKEEPIPIDRCDLVCKEVVWKWWSREYLRSLQKRHRLKIKHGPVPKVKDVVIISDNEKKGEWTLRVVEELVTRKDSEVRVAKIPGNKSHLERAVPQLYPLELSCNVEQPNPPVVMNPQVPVF